MITEKGSWDIKWVSSLGLAEKVKCNLRLEGGEAVSCRDIQARNLLLTVNSQVKNMEVRKCLAGSEMEVLSCL